MHNKIILEDALKLTDAVFIDVRSPKEFAEGKIYGAVNIPLLNDEERAVVGTVYKNEGAQQAKEQGLALVAGRLPEMVEKIKALRQKDNKLIIYCWRGGMRSKAVADILGLVGVECRQLLGGYKNYRRHVLTRLQNFELKPQIVVLCGSTGTGKTAVLKLLAQKNLPVIDLEELANHRGSVFGHIGLKEPSKAQIFDMALLNILDKFNDEPYIVVECESKRIGNVYLPDALYHAMRNGKKILLSAGMDVRISRLTEEYLDKCRQNKPQIEAKIELLRPRLGNKKTDYLLILLKQDNITEAVKILLTDYYDPLYGYEKADKTAFDECVSADNLQEAADKIAGYLNELGGRRE